MAVGRFHLRMGLRGELVLLFLLVSLAPLLVVSYLAYWHGKLALKNTIGESLAQLAQEKITQADHSIVRQLEVAEAQARAIGTKVSQTNQKWTTLPEVYYELVQVVRQFEKHAGPDSQIIITNLERRVLGSSKESLNFQLIDEDWWDKAYNNGIGYKVISGVQYDTEKKLHYLSVALPIPDEFSKSNVVGVMKAILPLPQLAELVKPPATQNGDANATEICLINEFGRVLAASPNSGYDFLEHIEMSDAAIAAIQAAASADGRYYGYEMGEERDVRGEKRVYGWARTHRWLKSKGSQNFKKWTVLVSQPTALAFYEVARLTNRILTFTLISCIIVIPIALIFARRIVNPIMQVAKGARAIGHGKFDQEIPVTSSNEVGVLAEEFNAMRRNLKNAVGKLTEEEKKMTAIVNSLVEGLILVDSNNRVLHINPAAEYLLNVSGKDIGRDFAEMLCDETLINALKGNQLQIALNKPVTSEVALTHNAEKLVLRVIASPFLDENGFTLGTVYVFDDITREKEIDQMKSDFISLVSHELRTPLTSIIGFVSFILEGKAGLINEKQRNSLVRVQRQSKRLAALINDLLDVSRIESGRIQMKHEPISLLEIASQRIEEIRPQADDKSIKLSLVAPESLPRIIGDEARIGQVFTNLIGNAIKFTPNNGEVTVRLKVDGNLLHVEVIDTGPGIPIEERRNVFDKFYQLSDIHTRQQGGSGLGLSITKSIVESHGGTIWVDDGERGKGSNFQFVLPLFRKELEKGSRE